MSVVIDGFDIVPQAAYISKVMKSRLNLLLSGKETSIPPGVLTDVRALFSVGRDYLKLLNGQSPVNERTKDTREIFATYLLLIDMMTGARARSGASVSTPYDTDSELEELAEEIQLLDSSGRRVGENRNRYVLLRDIFEGISKVPHGHVCGQVIRSKYSIGTFDDGDDD